MPLHLIHTHILSQCRLEMIEGIELISRYQFFKQILTAEFRDEPSLALLLAEPVKWVFDFGNAPEVNAGDPLHMWIWSPNTASDPNEPVRLTDEGNKVWSLTLTPTEFFRMTADQILNNGESAFWFNIRGDVEALKETGSLSIPKKDYVAEFIESGKRMAFAPSNFTLDGTLSILFNANLVEGFLPAPSTLHMHGSMNSWTHIQSFDAWIPETRAKTAFKHLGGGIYRKDLVPLTYFPGVTEETVMENLTFVIAKYNGNDAAPDWAGAAGAENGDFVILAPGVPVPPPANFYLFPLKVSLNDILVITRDNNDRGQRLSYSLTDGTKTLTGEMAGAMTQQRAFVNVAGEFKGSTAAALTLTVTDNKERVIYRGEIPLVKPDALTE